MKLVRWVRRLILILTIVPTLLFSCYGSACVYAVLGYQSLFDFVYYSHQLSAPIPLPDNPEEARASFNRQIALLLSLTGALAAMGWILYFRLPKEQERTSAETRDNRLNEGGT